MEKISGRKIASFEKNSLLLDPVQETERIVTGLREVVHQRFHRQGAVVGISGGVDSSVVLALSVHAFGRERVLGVLLPERDSSPESAVLAQELADSFGVRTVTEDITPALEAFGCYRRRDTAIQSVFPQYQPGWSVKIVLPGNLLELGTLNFFTLIVTDPQGNEARQRLQPGTLAQIMAASNFKQRARMCMLYYHAELHRACVIGTANKNEYDLGFFVKNGDAGVDVNPIQHLYKTQVYQLARHLEIPQRIQNRVPTTDTYPGGGSQEEFYFRIPYEILDVIWYGFENGIAKEEIATALDLTAEQVQRVIDNILHKQRAAEFLRSAPVRIPGDSSG